jgi:K+-sensing histidine kinase KdpD
MRAHALAVLAVAVAALALRLLGPLVNQATVALGLLLPVLFIATRAGVAPAVTAAIAGVVAFNYLFLPPVGTLTIADPLNWIALGVFLTVAVTAGGLFGRARERAIDAERLYRELQTAGEAAARAQTIRESDRLKTALLDAVTHALRTPLTGIKAAATALAGEGAGTLDAGTRGELLTVVLEEVDRLDRRVEDLISLARVEAGGVRLARRWCAIEDVIAAARARLEMPLRGHPVEVALPAELPVVYADARALEEILVQLLGNAAAYSSPAAPIRVSADAEGEVIEVRVDDTGPGIPPDDRERMFEKFRRGDDVTAGGLGMGLAIARGLAQAHGGRLTAEGPPSGRGARFVLRLPIGEDREPMESPA